MILEVNRADLLICIGMGLEDGWLPVLVSQSRNGKVQRGARGYLDASEFITPLDVVANPNRSMGDVHGSGNPHYYNSPTEMLKVAAGIYARLVELDRQGAETYGARWKAFQERYREKLAQWSAALAPVNGTKVVEYHKSWAYLLAWTNLVSAGVLEPIPGIPPSPSHVASLLSKVRDQKIRFVIQEVYQPTRLSKLFAEKSGAKLLILPSMVGAVPGITTVLEKFDRIVSMLTAG
jgi:zinc/manganese transport system substrate-binding protein